MDNDVILKDWPEISRALVEKRYEISLSSIDVTKRKPDINDEQVQDKIFHCGTVINYLEITRCGLNIFHASLANARKLAKLVLHSNELKRLPDTISELKELQFLDLSTNKLEKLPDTIGSLPRLTTLLLSHNKLTDLPDLSGLQSLQHFDVSYNQVSKFPNTFPKQSSKLQTLSLKSNLIEAVGNVEFLGETLKSLDISDNRLKELPCCLANLTKLKTLELGGNRFADNRFKKLAEDPRRKTNALLEYLKKKSSAAEKKSKKDGESNEPSSVAQQSIAVHFGLSTFTLIRNEAVIGVRPYVVCCIVRNCSFDPERIKVLLNIQNKLHSGTCEDRMVASIGTHDCNRIKSPVIYTAVDPDTLMITPLNRHKKISGREFLNILADEIESARKREKRNVVSSARKYICVVKKLSLYPCFVDANGLVISMPPVTNSEETKLTSETKDMLVEVTSGESQDICRSVMDLFLKEVVSQNVATPLHVEQLKIMQHTGELLVAYPGRYDLCMDGIKLRRETVTGRMKMFLADASDNEAEC